MLNYIINLLKALNSNSKPSQIANSFCIGLILGFMPKNNLLWSCVFCIRKNKQNRLSDYDSCRFSYRFVP